MSAGEPLLAAGASSSRTANPSDGGPAAADTYAWALYKSGRPEEAKRYSDEALSTGAIEPLYRHHAGALWMHLKALQ